MSLKSIINFDEKGAGSAFSTSQEKWTVLSVEDDINYQKSIELSLDGLEVDGKGIEILRANSAVEAAAVLSSVGDISVILLDVVMESDDAGLRVVDTIRNVIGDDNIRIVLVTGQPGVNAPRQSLMKQYDIDDYWTKTDLTEEKLRSVVMSNIRTWHSLTELNRAKRGLQMIVDASRVITSKLDIEEFSKTVLQEVGKIVGVPNNGGIACVVSSDEHPIESTEIVASTGSFSLNGITTLHDVLSLNKHPLPESRTLELAKQAQREKRHIFNEGLSILYFSTQNLDNRSYLMLVESPNSLDEQHVALLRVFCENVKTGFTNLALLNKLSKLAYYDSELNIPNRNWLTRELKQANSFMLSNMDMVIINISNFSEAKVMLGYRHTELMVRALYQSINANYKHAKAICRIAHNQLAVLFSRINTPTVDELEALTEQAIVLDNISHTVISTVCIADLQSIAAYSASDMITIVEMALTAGRESGKSVVQFTPSFTDSVAERHIILQDLYQALQVEDVFQIALQPKVNMLSGEVVGAEALLRWTKQDGTVMPPGLFIPIAEASGIMNKIDSIVMKKTIEAIKRLCNKGINIPISFNVTCSDITTTNFIENLVALLSASGIESSLLEIEITESQAMEDYEEVNPVLKQLLSMGVKVSVDDFGTGYSSLAHIADLAVSTLKVDRSFVTKLSDEKCAEAGFAVCEMVFRLAKRFNFNIIAEGVETEEQKNKLIEGGYEFAQGYLFAKPMTIEDFEALYKKTA
jgi:EAL domain-containing protein (putative c-di-GMP-specific phosphodiesterase class I)/GGDEF domain-containing protein